MQLTQRDVAAIIARLERIDEERQQILDILLPDRDDEPGDCVHPADQVADHSTLGTEEYHCHACGQTFSQDPRTTTTRE